MIALARAQTPLVAAKLLACHRISAHTHRAATTSTGSVRVRFAPSPTGKLHIGGLRTALYNYLFARKHAGVFILRIEDTDQERTQEGALANIVDTLRWAGIEPDLGPHRARSSTVSDDDTDGPWIQSQRLALYRSHADELLRAGKAYRCFCDAARLELLRRNAQRRLEKIGYDGKCRHLSGEQSQRLADEGRPHVVRFRLEDRDVCFDDLTTGAHRSNPFKSECDFVLLKSDGFPTYHLASVVDDHYMRITHVLRGQEWQISTAKHVLLYEAFGWRAPVYSHLPLICNSDGTKISKRQNDIDVLSYRTRGYRPHALLLYLTTIGGGLVGSADWISSSSSPSSLSLTSVTTKTDGNIIPPLLAANSRALLPMMVERFNERQMIMRPVKLDIELLNSLNRRVLQVQINSNEPADRAHLVEQLRALVRQRFCADGANGLNNKDIAESEATTTRPLDEHYTSDSYLTGVLCWAQSRISTLNELVENAAFGFVWHDVISLAPRVHDADVSRLVALIDGLERLLAAAGDTSSSSSSGNASRTDLITDAKTLKNALSSLFKRLKENEKSVHSSDLSSANYWMLSRFVLTGSLVGPPVIEVFQLLGATTVTYRLRTAREYFRKHQQLRPFAGV